MHDRPWLWRIGCEAWLEQLRARANAWQPVKVLRLDDERLRDALLRAIDARAGWLWHPCMNRLTLAATGRLMQRDLQASLWIASHDHSDLGTVTAPTAMRAWAPFGAVEIPPGVHSLRALALSAASEVVTQPALDLWSETLAEPSPQTWAAIPPESAEQETRLKGEVLRYLRAVTFLQRNFAACSAWVSDVTHVAIPFRGEGGVFRSCSHPGIPGVVELDLLNEVQILEALVHESAHLYLYRAECQSPLIDPGYQGLHDSPLRPEPRPLRGILLALHALAYIALFYREAQDINTDVADWCGSGLAERLEMANEAADTIDAAAQHLTPGGTQFVAQTMDVLAHAGR